MGRKRHLLTYTSGLPLGPHAKPALTPVTYNWLPVARWLSRPCAFAAWRRSGASLASLVEGATSTTAALRRRRGARQREQADPLPAHRKRCRRTVSGSVCRWLEGPGRRPVNAALGVAVGEPRNQRVQRSFCCARTAAGTGGGRARIGAGPGHIGRSSRGFQKGRNSSILGQRSITTFSPASSASLAARSS